MDDLGAVQEFLCGLSVEQLHRYRAGLEAERREAQQMPTMARPPLDYFDLRLSMVDRELRARGVTG